MEEKAAEEEEQEYTILREQPQCVAEPLVFPDALASAASTLEVDLPRLNEQRGSNGGRYQASGGDEDRAVAEEVADREDSSAAATLPAELKA